MDNVGAIGRAKGIELGAQAAQETHLACLPLDSPQFEIRLKRTIPMKGAFGAIKPIMIVVLRVDDPAAFEEALSDRLSRYVA